MIHFDSALVAALAAVRSSVGCIPKNLHAVRDMAGALTLVWPADHALHEEEELQLKQALHDALNGWSSGLEQVLLLERHLLDPADVYDSPDRRAVLVHVEGEAVPVEVVLIDRLVTNQEWLRSPLPAIEGPKVATAFSIKGGVGRTTAFSVWAWSLARDGKRVAVLDLDLEAPGIASVLCEGLPDYGLVDWFVEALVREPEEVFLEDCMQPWTPNADLQGSVHVLPAFGTKTQSYVEKLGRVFVSTFDANKGIIGFSERVHMLLLALQQMQRFDVILIDSRAGLHDIGASLVTRVGAEVFMFARDETQSWSAYNQLFRHLRYSHAIRWNRQGDDSDLRWRLKMVGAQAEPEEASRVALVSRSYDCWLDLYDGTDSVSPQPEEEFNLLSFAQEDAAAPHYPLVIPFDPRVRGFRLNNKDTLPSWDLVYASYGPFIEGANERLFPSET